MPDYYKTVVWANGTNQHFVPGDRWEGTVTPQQRYDDEIPRTQAWTCPQTLQPHRSAAPACQMRLRRAPG